MRGDREYAWRVVESPIGPLLLAATGQGLVQVLFHATGRSVGGALTRLEAALGARPVPGEREPLLARAAAQLAAYFAGELRAFSLPLDWSLTSGFAGRALRELAASVPYGRVVTYGELASRVPPAAGEIRRRPGDPDTARAVGAAMGANPLPVVVPCHRVVAADGIGGFGGGLETKRALLGLEGVLPVPLF